MGHLSESLTEKGVSDSRRLWFIRICEDSKEITMPWTETTRRHYVRNVAGYASDTTDAEWPLIAPIIPKSKRLGRRRATPLRRVVDAIFYMASSGCQWRMLPNDFLPPSTVQGYFYLWRADGTWKAINHALLMQARERQGRDASPNAGIISVRLISKRLARA
jgi:transposase